MIRALIVGILLTLSQSAWAVTCPGGSAFELRRPSDNEALGCIDTNGNVIFGSSVTASAFFGDGSNLTGISGGGGSFNISIASDTSTQAEASGTFVDLIGSTVTLTTVGSTRVLIQLSAAASNSVAGNGCRVDLLQDGVSVLAGGIRSITTGADRHSPIDFFHVTEVLSAATYNWIVQFRKAGSGTCTIREPGWQIFALELEN